MNIYHSCISVHHKNREFKSDVRERGGMGSSEAEECKNSKNSAAHSNVLTT